MASLASPFVAALPLPHHLLFEYDADGDVIMTDAETGLPITYGTPVRHRRSRADSADSDADSRPSKRSRTSSDEDGGAAAAPAPAPSAPPAPRKAPMPPSGDGDGDGDGDGAETAARNLAEAMAEAVLDGDAAPAAEEEDEWGESEWMMSAKVKDLALPLEFRHPRVLLSFLRFVEDYNEVAPEGEEIHLPKFTQSNLDYVCSHCSVQDTPPEFKEQVDELLSLVKKHMKDDVEPCPCRSCRHQESDGHSYGDSDSDGGDSMPF